jgi:hypothetical protein
MNLTENKNDLRIEFGTKICELVRAILLELNGEGHDEGAVNNAVDRVIERLK